MKMRWLGPGIVIGGAVIAAVGIWFYLHVRPKAGDLIAAYPIDNGQTVLVRAEQGGNRSFVELRDGDRVVWQALTPRYVGTQDRPALAWSDIAISLRVDRDGRAEVFQLARRDAAKLGGFRLAPKHEPVTTQPAGPITLTDHLRSYEIVGGADWHEMIAVDLHTGHALWDVPLGKDPIVDGGVRGGSVWLIQGNRMRELNVFTGAEDKTKTSSNPL